VRVLDDDDDEPDSPRHSRKERRMNPEGEYEYARPLLSALSHLLRGLSDRAAYLISHRLSPLRYSADYVRSRTRRTWEERYEELKQFQQKHGHLYIPYSGTGLSLSPHRPSARERALSFDPPT
jgi:hypothetical protein